MRVHVCVCVCIKFRDQKKYLSSGEQRLFCVFIHREIRGHDSVHATLAHLHAIAGGRGEKVTLLTAVFVPVVQGEGRMVRWEKNVSTAFCVSLSFSGLRKYTKIPFQDYKYNLSPFHVQCLVEQSQGFIDCLVAIGPNVRVNHIGFDLIGSNGCCNNAEK